MQRVTTVAKQIAQQAQAAVAGGVEVLRDVGGNIAERVGDRVGGGSPDRMGGGPSNPQV
jgi:hypothetical protein